MSLKNLFTKSVIISRLSAVSGNKTTWTTQTSENVHIMQLDAEKSINLGGSVGKTYMVYADVTADITDGDILQDEDGNQYIVKAGGVSSKTLGSIDHLEVLVEKVND